MRAVHTTHQHFLKLVILGILNEQYVLRITQYHILRKINSLFYYNNNNNNYYYYYFMITYNEVESCGSKTL